MKLTFWGVRGSIPVPGRQTQHYGGNTTCIGAEYEPDHHIIIDAGSGIRCLGNHLLSRGIKDISLLLSHTHWDHIFGFPFFVPIYIPGTQINIYGPVAMDGEPLAQILGNLLTYKYFPVRHDELRASIAYNELKETSFTLPGGVQVRSKYLNHPLLTLGYRFEKDGKSWATCFDHEPYRNLFADNADFAEDGQAAADEYNQQIMQFYQGVDCLIHDAQYTAAEYAGKIGWGHSSIADTIAQAAAAGVKRLLLFHHDPDHDDAFFQQLSREFAASKELPLPVEFAREGESIELY